MERFNKIAVYALFIIIISCSIFLIFKINSDKKEYDEELYAEIYEEYEELSKIEYSNSAEYTKVENDISIYKKNATGKAYKVIASISIPKISVYYPIIEETTEEYLKIAPTKLWGPNPNEEGNLCIIGHNWEDDSFFSNLERLEENDVVRIKDNLGNAVEYKVYDKYTVRADDLECTSQDTNGKTEITLITCTNNKNKRLIVKGSKV